MIENRQVLVDQAPCMQMLRVTQFDMEVYSNNCKLQENSKHYLNSNVYFTKICVFGTICVHIM